MNDIERAIGDLQHYKETVERGCLAALQCESCNQAISALEKQIKSNDDYKQLKQRIEDTIKHYEEQIEEINELGPSQQLIGMRNGYEQVIEDLKTDIELGELKV